MPAEFRSGEGVSRFAQELNALGARLRGAGIRLTYHNHSFELMRHDGRTLLETLYAETDPELVRAEIDTYWIQHGGGDPVRWIERLGGRLPLLHVKDMGIVEPMQQVDLPVGDGNLDWDRILAAARTAGVEWYVIEQDNPGGDPVECVARSIRFLRERLAA
jgi:sugar phosphate isomerase/epimerase